MNIQGIIGYATIALLFFSSCEEKNRLEVVLEKQLTPMSIMHIDSLLFHESDSLGSHLVDEFSEAENKVFAVYIENIMRISDVNDPYMWKKLSAFTKEQHWRDLQLDIDAVFYPFSEHKQTFEKAFSYYQYHFPFDTIPQVFTYHSGYNYGVYPSNNYIGVGLEWYVGADNKMVKQLPYDMFPNYIKLHMEPKFMVVDAVKGWLLVKSFKDELLSANFLENMMFYGKVMYCLDACFPHHPDEIKMGYSAEEMLWVTSNRENIWAQMVKEKMLFDSDKKRMNQWFLDAPFTAGLPQESPGKVGIWLGWQMVKQYMNRNEDVTLQMLQQVKAETILKNFKPNK